jgi:hypothetical protein
MAKIEGKPPISLLELSLRRTGSTTVYRALRSHPDIFGPSEPFSFHTRSKGAGEFDRSDPLSPINFAGVENYDPVYLHKLMEAHPSETWFLRHILSFNSSRSELLPKVRLNKETFISMQLGLALKLLPEDLKILYVTRDFRGIAASYKSNDLIKKWKIPVLFSQVKATVMANRELRERYADLFDVDESSTTGMELLMRKIIMFQSELNRFLLARDNVKVFEFEKFLLNSRKEMADVLNWIGVPANPDVLDQAESFTQVHMNETPGLLHPLYQHRSPHDWTITLTDQEIDLVEAICEKFHIPLTPINRADERRISEEFRQIAPREVISRTNELPDENRKLPFPERTIVMDQISGQLRPVKDRGHTFYMSDSETSNKHFASFLEWLDQQKIVHDDIRYLIYNPSRGKIKRDENGKWQVREKYLYHPVVSVTWLGAFIFSIWSGNRLPTLEEWKVAFNQGGSFRDENQTANYNQRYKENTSPVGYLPANAVGLFDMLGNVKEWTDTFISPESAATPGGSWEDTPLMLRNHLDNSSIATLSEKDLGFRVASSSSKPKIIDDELLTKKILKTIAILNNGQVAEDNIEKTYEKIRELFTI